MPVLNLMKQLVIVYLYTKYEHFILNGSGDIFDEKVLRNYGRTGGRTEERTDVNQYTPTFSKRGYNYLRNINIFLVFLYLWLPFGITLTSFRYFLGVNFADVIIDANGKQLFFIKYTRCLKSQNSAATDHQYINCLYIAQII